MAAARSNVEKVTVVILVNESFLYLKGILLKMFPLLFLCSSLHDIEQQPHIREMGHFNFLF